LAGRLFSLDPPVVLIIAAFVDRGKRLTLRSDHNTERVGKPLT
jgi:hypothetical protein